MRTYLFIILFPMIIVSCQIVPKGPTDKDDKNILEANPKLTKPVVEKIWIPDKIEDDGMTLTGRHWKYLIHRGTTWAE